MESEERENLLKTIEALEAVVKDYEERLIKAQGRIAGLMQTIQGLEAKPLTPELAERIAEAVKKEATGGWCPSEKDLKRIILRLRDEVSGNQERSEHGTQES